MQLSSVITQAHKLTYQGVASGSRKTYNSGLNTVKQFFSWLSEQTGHTEFIMNESLLRIFVAYVYNNKTVKDGTVAGYLTALRSFLIDSGIPFSRFDMPVLKRELIGYAFLRGNKPDTRVPVGVFNGKLIKLLNSCNNNTYEGKLKRITFLLQHKPLLRTEETGLASDHWDRVLKVSNFTWYPSFEAPVDIIVKKVSSKTDRLGRLIQHIPVTCECPGPCLVHELKNWLIFLALKNNGSIPASYNILQHETGAVVTASDIRKWFRAQCDILNWNKAVHKPYSLKIGRASDLYFLGVPALTIMDIGCWRTPCFMQYIRPQEQDNLFLLKQKTKKCSLSVLAAKNIKFQAYLGNKKDNKNRYEMGFNNTHIISGENKYLYKAKNGLYRPCLLINKNKTKATIIFIRCGKEKEVPIDSIIPYNEELVDKPHTDSKHMSLLDQLLS